MNKDRELVFAGIEAIHTTFAGVDGKPDSDFSTLQPGLSPDDIATLRSAFSDAAALGDIFAGRVGGEGLSDVFEETVGMGAL